MGVGDGLVGEQVVTMWGSRARLCGGRARLCGGRPRPCGRVRYGMWRVRLWQCGGEAGSGRVRDQAVSVGKAMAVCVCVAG